MNIYLAWLTAAILNGLVVTYSVAIGMSLKQRQHRSGKVVLENMDVYAMGAMLLIALAACAVVRGAA